MKNLMIYINPKGDWNDGWKELPGILKVQIDNSVSLGWDRRDIILITNFPWRYNGIEAVVFPGELYCRHHETATKINVICEMFNRKMIGDDIWWYHDMDAYQLADISDVKVYREIALTDYGLTVVKSLNSRPSTGIMFFDFECGDLFDWIREAVDSSKKNEEVALLAMMRKNHYGIRERIRFLNITHNLATRKRKVSETYAIANKPLRVLHFHPNDKRPVEDGLDNIDVCINGRNRINTVLATESLIDLFERHGVLWRSSQEKDRAGFGREAEAIFPF